MLAETSSASAPCAYYFPYKYIYCDDKNLNQTPHFLRSGVHVETLEIWLFSNNLVTIPNYAFKNLSSINATVINIQLQKNRISTIDRLAFSGIENVLKYLNLQYNNLSSLPSTFGDLHALKTLYLNNNPLKYLDVSTLSELGHTLQTMGIDLKEFPTWPTQFRLFHSMKTLIIRYSNFPHFISDAFQSFETSLTSLYIQYATAFDEISNAACQLSGLQSLTLENFSKLSENSTTIFGHCTKKLTKLTSVTMRFNHLTKFPDVFHIFPSLTSLNLQGNSLDIIEAEKIPINNILSSIVLDANSLKRIPNALNILKQLSSLHLGNNEIFSVEDHDLYGLSNLESLYLNNNPIKYISSHAFRYNLKLSTLILQKTSLVSIPAAVMSLPKLLDFDISNTNEPIQCTCDMSYLKGWNATAVSYFHGNCANSTTELQRFIMSSLQQCT